MLWGAKKKYNYRFKKLYIIYSTSNVVSIIQCFIFINCYSNFLGIKLSYSSVLLSSTNIKTLLLHMVIFNKLYIINSINTSVDEKTQQYNTIKFFTTPHQYQPINIVYVVDILSRYFTEYNKTQQPHNIVSAQPTTGLKQSTLECYELEKMELFFIRKNRVFNKGRYSRNRQNYRTGVFICFYLSIASIFGLYYTFYRVSFGLSYIWFFFFTFVVSFFFSKLLKYNLWSIFYIKNSFMRLIKWVFSLKY